MITSQYAKECLISKSIKIACVVFIGIFILIFLLIIKITCRALEIHHQNNGIANNPPTMISNAIIYHPQKNKSSTNFYRFVFKLKFLRIKCQYDDNMIVITLRFEIRWNWTVVWLVVASSLFNHAALMCGFFVFFVICSLEICFIFCLIFLLNKIKVKQWLQNQFKNQFVTFISLDFPTFFFYKR